MNTSNATLYNFLAVIGNNWSKGNEDKLCGSYSSQNILKKKVKQNQSDHKTKGADIGGTCWFRNNWPKIIEDESFDCQLSNRKV